MSEGVTTLCGRETHFGVSKLLDAVRTVLKRFGFRK